MFKDRKQAGKLLAKKLKNYKNKNDAVVFGITRGGVIVASEIAKSLKIPLESIVIKKIGAPLNPELAIGAVGPRGTVYWDERLFREIFVSEQYKKEALKTKIKERNELEKFLRGMKKSLKTEGKRVILVDDGVATGATVLAALKFLRGKKAKEVILATAVIANDTYNNIEKYFDSIVALRIAERLNAIGQFYKNFEQVENNEVKDIINKN